MANQRSLDSGVVFRALRYHNVLKSSFFVKTPVFMIYMTRSDINHLPFIARQAINENRFKNNVRNQHTT